MLFVHIQLVFSSLSSSIKGKQIRNRSCLKRKFEKISSQTTNEYHDQNKILRTEEILESTKPRIDDLNEILEKEDNTNHNFEYSADEKLRINKIFEEILTIETNCEKQNIIKTLETTSEDQDKGVQMCNRNFIRILEHSTLKYPLKWFAKLIKYYVPNINRASYSDKAEFINFKKYIVFVSSFLKLLNNANPIDMNNIEIETLKKYLYKYNSKTFKSLDPFLSKLVCSYTKYMTEIKKIIQSDLQKLTENFIDIEDSDLNLNYDNIYDKTLKEILNWFQESIFRFFCNSELYVTEKKLTSMDTTLKRNITPYFIYLYFYGIKILSNHNMSKFFIERTEDHVDLIKNEEFLRDIFYLKCLFREILVKYLKIYPGFALIYKITNLFIFLRLFFPNQNILISDMDLWLMEQDINRTTIKKFGEEENEILKLPNYNLLNDQQKKYFFIFYLRCKFKKRCAVRFTNILNSINPDILRYIN
ncbi:hypothetical protein H312_03174 [Anncaliia algerae PRA339]|uniref:Uncharacterized protein n=1 Tax=Anncaliia algerae PRA339 TaxID=1288291 RepID=A0A059EWL9_9MICR|nr:hypothetical protein H312_03174 [Anncaliia algerae PRA339]